VIGPAILNDDAGIDCAGILPAGRDKRLNKDHSVLTASAGEIDMSQYIDFAFAATI